MKTNKEKKAMGRFVIRLFEILGFTVEEALEIVTVLVKSNPKYED